MRFAFPGKLLKVLAALASAALLAGASGCSDENRETMSIPPQKIRTVEGVSEYELENGLKVLLFPDAGKATATVCMTYLVGSRHEGYGETGMAHLLEHLMFKGSKNHPEPTKEFTRRGFDMNGSTWLDRTNYHLSFKSTEDNLNFAIDWMADAMVNSFIAQKDLDTEMTVVRNEYEMGENRPVSVLLKRMQSVLFDWHNYGNATIGAKSDIERVKIENLQAFYRRYYQPDNAVLTVAGNFDAQAVLHKIWQAFDGIKKPARKLEPMWTEEPVADGPRRFEIRRPGATRVVAVGYRIPQARHPQAQAVTLASDILGDTPRGRLHKALVEKGLATEVLAWPMPGFDPGLAMFLAVVPEKVRTATVERVMIQTIEQGFAASPVTSEELAVQATEETTEYERMFADPDTFATDISDFIGQGDWRLFFVQRDAWKKYTPQEVMRAASDYFVRDNRVVGVFIPDESPKRANFSPAPELAKLLESASFSEEGVASEAFEATPENIARKTEIVRFGDVTCALLPKKSRSGDVDVSIRLLWGSPKLLTGKNGYGELLSEMLERGTKTLSREAIENLFTSYRFSGSVTRFKSDGKTISKTLALIAELMNRSAIEDKAFEELRLETLTETRNKLDDPRHLATDALCRHFNTYPVEDPRHTLCASEKIALLEKLTAKDLRSFYRDDFATAKAVVAVVGNFEREAVVEGLKKIFVKKPAVPFERIASTYAPVPAARFRIDTPDKENAVLAYARAFEKPESLRERCAMVMANWIFGGSDGLSNRLMMRIRQKEGLSYGVGSNVKFSRFGTTSRFTASAILAPANLARAKAAFEDELKKALAEGFTEKELAEAKSGLVDARIAERSSDERLARTWVRLIDEGRDFSYEAESDAIFASLTLEEVNAAFRKMVVESELTVVEAGDLSKDQPLP